MMSMMASEANEASVADLAVSEIINMYTNVSDKDQEVLLLVENRHLYQYLVCDLCEGESLAAWQHH